MTQSLLFDESLELCDPDGMVSGQDYWFEALADGMSFGEPAPVEVALNSLLRDGSLTETQRDDNREASFVLRVKARDEIGLAEGLAALHRSIGKATTLVWSPPGLGPKTVFVVQTSSLHNPGDFDDLAYLRTEQVFRLRLVCLPYSRSVDKIVDNAGTPPSTGGTVLYNCESTSGWSTYAAAAPVVDTTIFTQGAGSIRVRAESAGYNAPNGVTQYSTHSQVTGLSLSTGAGGYFSVAVRTTFNASNGTLGSGLYQAWMTTTTGGEVEVFPSAATVDAAGFVHYVWPVAAGLTVTGVRFFVIQVGAGDHALAEGFVWYDDFELLPAATTDHQIAKQITVKGSARTVGSLRVSAPSSSVALGQVLAITTPASEIPAGFQPDGRRWVAQGATTADATALWGSYFTPTTTYSSAATFPIFDVPVTMLVAGAYTVVALVKAASSSLNFGVQAQLRVGSTDVGSTSSAEVSPTGLTTGWQFVTVGTVYLPPTPMQNADATAKVRLLFKGALFSDIYMIPAWQVGGQSVADFSIVDCGTGTVSSSLASSSLWIESPSVDQPQGGWWRGPTTDKANSRSAWPDAKKPGVHSFSPGALMAFLVSTGAAGPTLELSYWPSWYGSAAL